MAFYNKHLSTSKRSLFGDRRWRALYRGRYITKLSREAFSPGRIILARE